MKCPECYSEYSRITPLYKPEECLQRHWQYICSTCGRAICVDHEVSPIARCFMLFNSFEIAILYVRAAEVLAHDVCGIYRIESAISGKASYKIFPDEDTRVKYFDHNPDKTCDSAQPQFIAKQFIPAKEGQIRRLTPQEIEMYLEGHKADDEIRLSLLTK
jgi:hypothetical protein